jgi:hypothetical protein
MVAMAALVILSVPTLFPMRAQPVDERARAVSMLGSLREGFDHIRRDELIRAFVLVQIAFAILGQSFMQLVPAIAVDTLRVGARELSWMTAAVGVGALVGAFFIASVGRAERLGVLFLSMTGAVGVMLVVLGLQRQVAGAVVTLAVLGALHQVFMGTHAVVLQLNAPDRLRGRILGTQSLIFMSFLPLGVLIIGSLGTLIGISNAIIVAGLAVVAMTAGLWFGVRVVRDLRRGATPGVAVIEAATAD